ncbi:hypothetical protein [Streptacidiphilus fuscans]|uniref:Uncharacterized protein n=1 Tax=Streptacidiphilus fuscans TaxID=2789292 RepID=A0A931BF70_9ACTN|nr:hypothetical protein [Streptacidiphilus fuscans]MBF9072345.1 hypothetical protein [Streptacidiphilus fuscans]
MINLLAHALLTPALLAVVSFAARRFGPAVGGLLAGLPLLSGPVVVFAALDHGAAFAAGAAAATVGGALSATLLTWTYARMATRSGALSCLTAACVVFALSGAAQEYAHLGLASTVALALTCQFAALRWWPRRADALARPVDSPQPPQPPQRAGRLLGRMALVAVYALAATSAVGAVGPQLTGLLLPFPLLVATETVHLHRTVDGGAAREFLRSVTTSQFAALAWWVALSVLLPRLGTATAVLASVLLALAVQLAVAAVTAVMAASRDRVAVERSHLSPLSQATHTH